MKQQCAACRRPFALTFARCPFCDAPAGTKPDKSSVAPARPDYAVSSGERSTKRRSVPPPRQNGARTEPMPPLAADDAPPSPPRLELELGPMAVQSEPIAAESEASAKRTQPDAPGARAFADAFGELPPVPDLELSGIERRPSNAPSALDLDERTVEPVAAEEPPSEPVAEPSPSGAELWAAAAQASAAPAIPRVPGPGSPLHNLPVTLPVTLPDLPPTAITPGPANIPRGVPRYVHKPVVIAPAAGPYAVVPQLLLWLGLLCIVVGLTPLGCWYAFGRVKQVEIAALPGLKKPTTIELTDGVADWSTAVSVDLASPVPVSDPATLAAKFATLRGRLVALSAAPTSVYLYKQFRIGPNGERVEIPGVTRIYCPVDLTSSVWVVSNTVSAASFEHPDVVSFRQRASFVGVVQPLSQVVDLDDIRKSEVTNDDGVAVRAASSGVPDDALAVVAVPEITTSKVFSVTPIAGTKGRYLAVTVDQKPTSDQILLGEFNPCPSKPCEEFGTVLGRETAGLLVIHGPANNRAPLLQIAIFVLLGVALLAGRVVVKRKLEA